MTEITTQSDITESGRVWTGDGCSVPGWLGFFHYFRYYNKLFHSACIGHDWLYRNNCILELTRGECDFEFYLMMLDLCETREDRHAAYVYYRGVMVGGEDAYRTAKKICPIDFKALEVPDIHPMALRYA